MLLLVALYYTPQQGALAQESDTAAVATPPAGPLATLITQFTSMSPFELMNMTMQALVVAPLAAFAPAAEQFNASITETLRAFAPAAEAAAERFRTDAERLGAEFNDTLRAFAPAGELFNASIVETLRAFEPLTERVSTDINNTLRAFAPAAEDFARALNETGATLAQAVAPAAEEFRRAVAPAAEEFARFVNETGANVTAALEAVAPNRTANTNPTRRNLLDAEVVAANA